MNEFAMIAMILISGVIFYFTHEDEDEYYPSDLVEIEGIPVEDLK